MRTPFLEFLLLFSIPIVGILVKYLFGKRLSFTVSNSVLTVKATGLVSFEIYEFESNIKRVKKTSKSLFRKKEIHTYPSSFFRSVELNYAPPIDDKDRATYQVVLNSDTSFNFKAWKFADSHVGLNTAINLAEEISAHLQIPFGVLSQKKPNDDPENTKG